MTIDLAATDPSPTDAAPHPPGRGSHPAAVVPETLFDDPAAEQRWRNRFTAVRVSLPDPARDAEDRAVFVSNESGRFELVCWDVASGARVTATDRPGGTIHGTLSADGQSLWWFDDTEGNEFGVWRSQPFGAGPGSAAEALPGAEPGYPAGVEVGRTLAIAGFADDDGTRVHLARNGETNVVYRHPTDGSLATITADESIWVLSHSEGGDSRYPALRAYATDGNAVIADLDDTPGHGLRVLDVSPIPGDQRILVGHERRGHDQVGIWDPPSGSFTELDIDLPGDLDGCFTADGNVVVLLHTFQARTSVHRHDLANGLLTAVPARAGVVSGVVTRRDGSLWYRGSSAGHGAQLRTLAPDGSDRALLPAPDGGPADSVPVTDVWVNGPGGPIHALLARPADAPDGAIPTVFLVHGGPNTADEDAFDAERAAFVDAGFGVCQVNYRGSTGYGSAWRDALSERVGHTELADVAAVHDHLVATGRVDASASAIVGASWGGYLALLAIGAQWDRWAAAVAGVPIADYVAAYEDEMEPLRAFDRALFGGSPAERPDAYADASPLTWIGQVRTPLLVMAGVNDPRCPIRQVENYLDALRERRASYREHRYQAGHGSMVVAERLRQVACEVAFVREALRAG